MYRKNTDEIFVKPVFRNDFPPLLVAKQNVKNLLKIGDFCKKLISNSKKMGSA